jgi:pilus assembly protein CpaB
VKKIYLLSFLMALVVGVSVYFFADNLKQSALEKTVVNKGNVVVARVFIPVNTIITADMVMMADLPVEAINPLAINKLDLAVGAITQYPIEVQEQIFSTQIKKKGEAAEGRLSYVMDKGYRAVTVAVDEVTGVAGQITKGDYVDLVVQLVNAEIDDKHEVSFMIIENLQVLEIGKKQAVSATEAAPAATEYATVTLAATPEQVLKINYASKSGIRLVLRSVLDHDLAGDIYYPTVFPADQVAPAG